MARKIGTVAGYLYQYTSLFSVQAMTYFRVICYVVHGIDDYEMRVVAQNVQSDAGCSAEHRSKTQKLQSRRITLRNTNSTQHIHHGQHNKADAQAARSEFILLTFMHWSFYR